ncbi:pyruvate kinase isozyme G, chloroplastic-like [Gossypium australe]|uniref:Pyruvate kinase isozyme G, chloroplastic-like n=1 Tax=Gossypium australe TaxID=47621 RepID=A0A5B6W0K9_9ROSI|nr:pyruvate kinase isozyme G, chloroplastic-like [Gossypium australe]
MRSTYEDCGKSIESAIHAVRDCDFTQLVWKSLLPRNVWNVHWIIMNKWMLNVDSGEWSALFSIVTWFIWKNCNAFIFNGASSSSHELIASALAWTKSCGHSAKMSHLVCSCKTEQRWHRPDSGWVKINVDVSVSNNNTKATIGGAARDSNGKWLTSFNMVTGMDEIFRTEAQAIVEGMKLAWLEGYKHVEINCDNAMLIDTISNGFASISNIVEVRLIHEWCNNDWKVKFRHVWRGSNKVVDCLEKAAIGKINQIVLFSGPPHKKIRFLVISSLKILPFLSSKINSNHNTSRKCGESLDANGRDKELGEEFALYDILGSEIRDLNLKETGGLEETSAVAVRGWIYGGVVVGEVAGGDDVVGELVRIDDVGDDERDVNEGVK